MLRDGFDLGADGAQVHKARCVLVSGPLVGSDREGLVIPAMRPDRAQRLDSGVEGALGTKVVLEKVIPVGA